MSGTVVDLDLDAAYATLIAKNQAEDTWGEKDLHISDLAECPRKVAARRKGLVKKSTSISGHLQQQFGLAYETMLRAALDVQGIEYEYQVLVPPLLGHKIVGKADFVFRKQSAVLDTKTTTFWSGWVGSKKDGTQRKETRPPQEPKMQHRIQACSYAMALGMKHYGLQMVCRSTGERVTFWYETGDLRAEIEAALTIAIDTKKAESALPPWYSFNDDGTSWMCGKYCGFAACELNTNPELQVI